MSRDSDLSTIPIHTGPEPADSDSDPGERNSCRSTRFVPFPRIFCTRSRRSVRSPSRGSSAVLAIGTVCEAACIRRDILLHHRHVGRICVETEPTLAAFRALLLRDAGGAFGVEGTPDRIRGDRVGIVDGAIVARTSAGRVDAQADAVAGRVRARRCDGVAVSVEFNQQ